MWRIASVILIFMVIGLGLEFLALTVLVTGRPLWSSHMQDFLVFHGLGILLCGAGLILWLPRHYRKTPFSLATLILAFLVPLPGLGAILLIVISGILCWIKPNQVENKFVVGNQQNLTLVSEADPSTQHFQSVIEILHGRDNIARRKAILALAAVDPKKSIPILQKAIQDSDEQVRILAQTQFNKILATLELEVKALETKIAGTEKLELLLKLAEHYHELVYLGVSSEETQTIYLDRATELLHQALKLRPEYPAATFLLLKCSVKQQNSGAARKHLETLRRDGFAPEPLVSWEAEIYYQERNWHGLRAFVKKMSLNPAVRVQLQPQLEFWMHGS